MRDFPPTYPEDHPHVMIYEHAARPAGGGGVQMGRGLGGPRVTGPGVTGPLPIAVVTAGRAEPFTGMDPSNPATWVRPWNPQPGMIAYLNFNGATRQGYTPMGGVRRGPMRDRRDVPAPRPRWGAFRRHSA